MNNDGSGTQKIMVTGGNGLVGHAIQWAIGELLDNRFGKTMNEEWIFLSSQDGDLRSELSSLT